MSSDTALLACGRHTLNLRAPVIMGILNTTPDSFSDGGHAYIDNKLAIDLALRRAEVMLNEGATIIDIGGESTRPGSVSVSEEEELERVVPVVEAVVKEFDALVSVDTSTASVMIESAKVGAGLINDVRALMRSGALEAVANTQLPVCLMHMQGQPTTMQQAPHYQHVVDEVNSFLMESVERCLQAGITKERIILDPGFGFGKTLAHNLALLKRLPDVCALGFPVLVGMSRKSMIGHLLNRDVDERLAGSLGLAMLAAQKGAQIIRVHDVAATKDVLTLLRAVEEADCDFMTE